MRNAGMPKSDNNTKHGRSLSEEYKDKGFVRLRNREKLADVDSHSVPSRRGEQLWKDAEYTDDEEFIDLRYTACMSKKPINFTPDGYRLRCFEKNYRIKMFLVVTMYNEEDTEMERTMRGVNENLQHLVQSEGKEMWQRYLCCIVSDGRTKANPNTLNYMASLGFYDGDLIRKPSANFDVRLHMFEFTAQFREDDNFEAFFPPLQIIFALKEHNGGKLDSHMWYFNAFADQIRPTYCILIDVGTQPRRRAIYKLYRAMETNRRIAGVCGEIAAYKPNYINPVVAAQVFEYKISHILDKSLESTYGFITVLPGAFSAYRFEAIAEEDGKGPLVEYFKSSTTSMREMGAFKANMYLAEDRILCFEIIARKNHNWLLYYVKNAVAETDVPETLDILIRQRRRWLNGSFFALLYALLNFSRFYNDSSHGIGRKLVISTQFAYLAMNVFLNWILLANFYLAFNALVTSSSFIGSPESRLICVCVVCVLKYIILFPISLAPVPCSLKT
jgi:chitin synthase